MVFLSSETSDACNGIANHRAGGESSLRSETGEIVEATRKAAQVQTKSATKTAGEEKHHHDKAEKRLQDAPKKRLNIINPVRLWAVIREGELTALLKAKGHTAWVSRVRVHGLMLIIDYAIRKTKNGQFPMSAEMARSFISKIRKEYAAKISEPLPVLCDIGIFHLVRPGVCAHVHASAVYGLGDDFEAVFEITVALSHKLLSKRENAQERCDKGLNRKYHYREQLLNNLKSISFVPTARPVIATMLRGKGRNNVASVLSAVDSGTYTVSTNGRGQITTQLSSCPKELRQHLLLNGEPTIDCDTSCAHWNFLPRVLHNRLDECSHKSGREKYVADGWVEHDRLTLLLSSDDFYSRWCRDPQSDTERKQKKHLLPMLLNQPNKKCAGNRLYRWIAKLFPITFGTAEDLKRKDHRNLSKQLHRFTADAVAAALLELQRYGIAAVPLVDALICQEKNRHAVCEALGKHIFNASGVCATVGDIRYSPLTEEEQQALGFDEEAVADDGMSCAEWEAVRAVRCVAALKLVRRCPPLFSLIALTIRRLG